MKVTWNDIVRKLTSRKLWIAVAGLVSGIMLYKGADAGSVESITSIIMAFASVIAYIVGEGLADSAGARSGIEVMGVIETDKDE